jgi:hypothetical protein
MVDFHLKGGLLMAGPRVHGFKWADALVQFEATWV